MAIIRSLIIMLLFLPIICFAQEPGIRFDHSLSWKEIKAKAKEENKFIFLDIFTTWCNPCKRMAENVFTLPEVGKFFNNTFISVKVQMDKTSKDNDYVKGWYTDAALIAKEYGIMAYPTFLYFSPDGKLVHRFTSSTNAQEFIAVSAEALDPKKQNIARIDKNAKLSAAQLKEQAEAALKNYDPKNANYYFTRLLELQKRKYSADFIKLMDKFMQNSDDTVFTIYRREAEKIDRVMGKGYAADKVEAIIMSEEINSHRKGNKELDFAAIEKRLNQKYPAMSEKLLMKGKLDIMQEKNQREEYLAGIMPFMKKFGHAISPEEASRNAVAVIRMTKDSAVMKTALRWSGHALKEKRSDQILLNHAWSLYALGRHKEAIALQQEAIASMNTDKESAMIKRYAEKRLENMKKGEPLRF